MQISKNIVPLGAAGLSLRANLKPEHYTTSWDVNLAGRSQSCAPPRPGLEAEVVLGTDVLVNV